MFEHKSACNEAETALLPWLPTFSIFAIVLLCFRLVNLTLKGAALKFCFQHEFHKIAGELVNICVKSIYMDSVN